jgi:hypothetical protein
MEKYQFNVKIVLEARELETGVLHDVLRDRVAFVTDSVAKAEAVARFLEGTGIRLPELDEDRAIVALNEQFG